MVIKVLAIGDIGSIVRTIRKYAKKSEIYLINYPQDGSGVFTASDDVELFKTWKVSEHVKKINEIKDNYDICLTTASERIAYLADLNYIDYLLGGDIEAPRFEKNSRAKSVISRHPRQVLTTTAAIQADARAFFIPEEESGSTEDPASPTRRKSGPAKRLAEYKDPSHPQGDPCRLFPIKSFLT